MPIFEYLCKNCQQEFEELHSSHIPPITLCPNCNVDGYVQRQIPSIIHARVPLSGTELKQQIKKDSQKIKEKVKNDENLKANIVGETKYEEHLTAQKKLKDTYKF